MVMLSEIYTYSTLSENINVGPMLIEFKTFKLAIFDVGPTYSRCCSPNFVLLNYYFWPNVSSMLFNQRNKKHFFGAILFVVPSIALRSKANKIKGFIQPMLTLDQRWPYRCETSSELFWSPSSVSSKLGTKHPWVKNHWTTFNLTWLKAPPGERDSEFVQMKGNGLFQGEIVTKQRKYIDE